MNRFKNMVENPWFNVGMQQAGRLSLYNKRYLEAPKPYYPIPSQNELTEDYFGSRTCIRTLREDNSYLYQATYGGNGARIISNSKENKYGHGSANYVGEVPEPILSEKLEKFRIFQLPQFILKHDYYKKALGSDQFNFLVFNKNGVYRYGTFSTEYPKGEEEKREYPYYAAYRNRCGVFSDVHPDNFYFRGTIKGTIEKGDYLIFVDRRIFTGFSFNGETIEQVSRLDDSNTLNDIYAYHITTDEFENERAIKVLNHKTGERDKIEYVKDTYLFEVNPFYDALGNNYYDTNHYFFDRTVPKTYASPFKNYAGDRYYWEQNLFTDKRNKFKISGKAPAPTSPLIYNSQVILDNKYGIDSLYKNIITPGQKLKDSNYDNFTGISAVSGRSITANLKTELKQLNEYSFTERVVYHNPLHNEVYSKYKNFYVVDAPANYGFDTFYNTPKFTLRKGLDIYGYGENKLTKIKLRRKITGNHIELYKVLYMADSQDDEQEFKEIKEVLIDRVHKDFIDFVNWKAQDLKFEGRNEAINRDGNERIGNDLYLPYDYYECEEDYILHTYDPSNFRIGANKISIFTYFYEVSPPGDYYYPHYWWRPFNNENTYDYGNIGEKRDCFFLTLNDRILENGFSPIQLGYTGVPFLYSLYFKDMNLNPYVLDFPEDEEILMSFPSNPGYVYFEQFVEGGVKSSGIQINTSIEVPKEDIELKEEPNEKPKFEIPEIDISSGPNTEEIKNNEELTEEEKEEKLQEEEEQTSGGKNTEVEVDVGLIVDEDKLKEEGIELPKDEEGNEYIEVEIEVEVTDSLGNKYKIKKRVFYVNPRGKNNKGNSMFDLSSLGLPPNVKIDSVKVTITPEEEELKDKLDLEVKITIRDILNPATQQSVLENPALTLNGIVEIGELKENWTITSKSLSGNTKKIKLSDPLTAVEKYVIIKTRSKKESVIITDTITAEENFVINKEEVV